MTLPLSEPPQSLCLLRLSAIGDCTHMLPIIHAIRAHWPEVKITWIIGKIEYSLMNELEDVEFIVFDKSKGKHALKEIKSTLKSRQFDLLLNMQAAFRASMISRHVKAPIKLGFDKARAKDFQWLFTTHKISGPERVHVIDTFFQFLHTLGVPRPETLSWHLPLSANLPKVLPEQYILIAPCSSREDKDWPREKYVELIHRIKENTRLPIVIAGGPSERERSVGDYIASNSDVLNLIGKTSLKEMQAVINGAICLVSPDSGPAHMATIGNTPVISLFATTNPHRTGPYNDIDNSVNVYPKLLEQRSDNTTDDVKWGKRINTPEAMNLIETQEVLEKVIQFL